MTKRTMVRAIRGVRFIDRNIIKCLIHMLDINEALQQLAMAVCVGIKHVLKTEDDPIMRMAID